MRIYRVCAVALSLAAALLGKAVAQDLRGGELRINQVAAGAQSGIDVAALPNGDFVAVWYSRPVPSESSVEIKARRFFADGRAKGGDVFVARIPRFSFYSGSPKVAADAAGRFWVVWEEPAATENGARVFGQRFDAAGRKLGPRLRFNASDFGQVDPDVAMTPDGGAVVVWESFTDRFDYEGVRIAEIYFRRLRPDGAFAGPAVFALTEGETSRVAMRGDGSFGIASEVYNGEASFYDIYLSLFEADGRTLREPFEITSGSTEIVAQINPAIAAASDGRMFVAWTDRAGDFIPPGTDSFDHEGVAGQLIAADGTPIGDNVKLNRFQRGSQSVPSVAATPSGGFLVGWTSGGNQDGDAAGIFARHLAPDGRPLGGEIRMNLARQGSQAGVALALAPNGHGVAAWVGPDGAGSFDLFARRLAPPERSDQLPVEPALERL